MGATYKVAGMTCQGCVRSVTNAIKHRAPAASVQVDLAKGLVMVEGAEPEQVSQAVDEAGFEFKGAA